MSFDLAVWHEPGPITVDEAEVTYQAICAGSSKLRTHPSVRTFRVEIAKRYPPETEERSLSASPWAAPLVASRSFVLMSCAPQWPGFLLLVEEIRDLAGRLGLLCYDPQEQALLRPATCDARRATRAPADHGPWAGLRRPPPRGSAANAAQSLQRRLARNPHSPRRLLPTRRLRFPSRHPARLVRASTPGDKRQPAIPRSDYRPEGSGSLSVARWVMTVVSTASARLRHRWNRSATWIAFGAPVRAPSNGA